MRAPKAHLAKSGITACGRPVGKLKIAHDLHPAQSFVLLKASFREPILATVTCAACVRGRYRL